MKHVDLLDGVLVEPIQGLTIGFNWSKLLPR